MLAVFLCIKIKGNVSFRMTCLKKLMQNLKNRKHFVGPDQVAQLVRALSPCAAVAGPVPSQGACNSQPTGA